MISKKSTHEAQSKGKLWLSSGRKVYSGSDLHTAMCRGVDDYGNKQKIVAKGRVSAGTKHQRDKGSKMVQSGGKEYLPSPNRLQYDRQLIAERGGGLAES